MLEPRRRQRALLAISILLVAANLRPAASSVGPLIHLIRSSTDLSSAGAGVLLTLPALCFGALAPLAAVLARRFGVAATIALALAAIICGLLVRLVPSLGALYAGTALACTGIAVGNVLLPVLVKRSFGTRIGLMSGLYTMTLIANASLGAGLTVPLTHALGFGWRGGLGFWAIPAALALAAWIPQLRRGGGDVPAPAPPATGVPLLRDPLAWQLAVFFGFQAAGFYAVLSWLPSIFQSHGIGATRAGVLLAVSLIVQLPVSLTVPAIAARRASQRGLAVAFTVVTGVGFTGLLVAPVSGAWVWVTLLGIGQGACFPLSMTMIVLRSTHATQTAALSTLVQTVGYLIAATGPLVMGVLHDATDSWRLALALLVAATVPQAALAMGAGRNLHVGRPRAADG